MQVEIWSDVVCPFCYIGKRQLEAALERVPDRHRVQVTWRSFQAGALRMVFPGLASLPFGIGFGVAAAGTREP